MSFFKKKEVKMIDMHCHILPGVDDGSSDMEETLMMLRIAVENGISIMIVTPHYKPGRRNADCNQIRELIQTVAKEAGKAGLSVSLYPGNELYYFSGAEDLLVQSKLYTLNDTDRVLIEFSPNESFQYIRNAVESIGAAGFVPVLAHVERYGCLVRHFTNIEELMTLGAEVQVNISSIFGKMGSEAKTYTRNLLKQQYIDYLGTDAHDCKKRTPEVADQIRQLYKKYDPEYIDAIVYQNALALVEVE